MPFAKRGSHLAPWHLLQSRTACALPCGPQRVGRPPSCWSRASLVRAGLFGRPGPLSEGAHPAAHPAGLGVCVTCVRGAEPGGHRLKCVPLCVRGQGEAHSRGSSSPAGIRQGHEIKLEPDGVRPIQSQL